MQLPAGLIPNDLNIELFGDPNRFGKVFFIQNGQTKPFNELPYEVKADLSLEMELDTKAVKVLQKMGISENNLLEQYNYCNRGKLDGVTDITTSGKLTHEYVDCGRRGKCIGEGIVCKPVVIEGKKITYRETECLRLLGSAKRDKQIKVDMGFKSQASVNSLMVRLRSKMDVTSRSEMIIKANQIGII